MQSEQMQSEQMQSEQMQSEVEWHVLDIETDEWERRMATLDVAAAANGFPLAAAPARPKGAGDERVAAWTAFPRLFTRRAWPWLAAAAVALVLLVAVAGYVVWRTAEQGLVQIQGDIANAVHLETVKDRAKLPGRRIADGVEAVELIDKAALAYVVITATLPSGAIDVSRQMRFYSQTATGWQRTGPVAALWGPSATLDTVHLHFTFGAPDREVIELVAPTAETLYAGLVRATGQQLTAGDLLTIEVVPGTVAQGAAFDGSHIRVPSPALLTPVFLSREQTLARLLRDGMCEPMRAAALRHIPVKPQWQPLAESFDCLLLAQATLTLASAPAALPAANSAAKVHGHAELDSLLDWPPSPSSDTAKPANRAEPPQVDAYLADYEPSPAQQRRLSGAHLLFFIGASYGLDSLQRLLQGFGEYDDWESLAPATLGISATELERAWRATPARVQTGNSLFAPVAALWTK